MDLHIQQKSFLDIFLKTLIYLVLAFIIVWSSVVAYDEYDIYATVFPEVIPYTPPVAAPLTDSEKADIAENLNATTTVFKPEDAAQKLNAIPKPKSTLTDEEKNKILQGLE
ncbi:MAG: hypothetical protein JWP09_825 [Candidatus Taylorbacteria bacterium]|nr:hypothetical protein [Candidatus Taylorbacteria bacterium]